MSEAALQTPPRHLESPLRREDPLQFLSEASALLSHSLDVEATLQAVAGMVVPALADGCQVELADEGGAPKRVAQAGAEGSGHALPLRARGRTLGTLTLVGPRELAIAQDLAARAALEAGNLGSWEWQIQRGRIYRSPTLERIHGLEPGSFQGTFAAGAEVVPLPVEPPPPRAA